MNGCCILFTVRGCLSQNGNGAILVHTSQVRKKLRSVTHTKQRAQLSMHVKGEKTNSDFTLLLSAALNINACTAHYTLRVHKSATSCI